MSLKKFWKNFNRLLFPKENIAGLEIKDTALRIAQFQDGLLKKAAVPLELDVIKDGWIKDKPRLIAGLKRLRAEFAQPKEKTLVIASIPSANAYTQAFNTPLLSGQSLEEAANLNLKSISPLDLKDAYADWQVIGIQEKDSKLEFLAAFADSSVINAYRECLEAAGFAIIAVEFPALAISRAIKELAVGVEIKSPQIVINVASDGIDFMVLRGGNLHFHYFTPWKMLSDESASEKEMAISDFRDTVVREVKKVITFYSNHWEGKLDKLVLVSQALNSEIAKLIKENFNFDVVNLRLADLPDLEASWFGAVGSALRGRLARSEDTLISLTPLGTEKEYFYSQIKFFIKMWRNVFAASLVFLILIFILSDSVLYRLANQLNVQLQTIAGGSQGTEVAELQNSARQFNQFVDKAIVAKEASISRSALLTKINSLLKREISIIRISFDSQQSSVLLIGRADNEAAAVAFKNSLIKEGFQNVVLPLSRITANPDKSVSFTVTFRL